MKCICCGKGIFDGMYVTIHTIEGKVYVHDWCLTNYKGVSNVQQPLQQTKGGLYAQRRA